MRKSLLICVIGIWTNGFGQSDSINAVNFIDSIDLFQKGFTEAREIYRGDKVLLNSAFISLLPFGLFINGIRITIPAKLDKKELLTLKKSNTERYKKGYQKGAAHKKNKSIIIGSGIGLVLKSSLLIYALQKASFSSGGTGWGWGP